VEEQVPTVEIDQVTDQFLEFAAKVAGISKGEVVTQLVATSQPAPVAAPADPPATSVPIHADYEGHRTHARFHPGPGRIEITDGPLAGTSYRTPSEAARAVVAHYKPDVSPHRNGWHFWIITKTGGPLQAIRHSRP
jgi:hypothetical protein